MKFNFTIDGVDFDSQYIDGKITVHCPDYGVTERAEFYCPTIPQIELYTKMLAMGILEREGEDNAVGN